MKYPLFFSKFFISVALFLFVFVNLLMKFSPFGTDALAQLTGNELIPDTLFYYSPQFLYNLLADYGLEGRLLYLNFQLLDYFYPLIYGYLLMAFWYRIKNKNNQNYEFLLSLIPVFFDFAENIIIRFLVVNFISFNPSLAILASVFSSLKWLFLSFVLVRIVYLYIIKIRLKA